MLKMFKNNNLKWLPFQNKANYYEHRLNSWPVEVDGANPVASALVSDTEVGASTELVSRTLANWLAIIATQFATLRRVPEVDSDWNVLKPHET